MAVTKPAAAVTVPLTLNIPEFAYAYLEKNAQGDPVKKLSQWITYYLSQVAMGGLMIEAVDHDHLAELRDGKRFRSSREAAREIEKALKREDGQFSYTLQIDPAYIKSVEERAVEQGVTVESFVKDLFAYIMGSGFVYDFTPTDGCQFPVEYQDMQEIKRMLGRDVTAGDLVGLMREGIAARRQELVKSADLVAA